MKTANPVPKARALGAKLHRAKCGRWVCLDMHGTPLFTLTFDTIERAARAYLIHAAKSRLTLPATPV